MFLYTADGYTGKLKDCDEGTLEWIEKSQVYELPVWEGDKGFFRILEEERGFFDLKLRYKGNRLEEAVLDGRRLC